MNDEQVVTLLRTAGDDITPPVEALVRGAVARGELRRRRRRARVLTASSAGALAVAVLGVAVVPRLGPATGRPPASTPPAGAAATCPIPLRTDPLPPWATAGFSDPTASGQPHAIGAAGKITAILFGPLSYPESKGVANKVLWVTKVTAEPKPLVVDARLEGTSRTVQRIIPGGPGPSYLELPHAGCWQLSLSWDGGEQHDTLELPYGG